MVKKGEIEEGEDTDISLWNDMKTYISNTDMSVEKNYQKASDMIDINSFIDYYATEMYIGRYNDWPESNYAAWRVKNVEQSKYGDGKWRWMLFDVNSGEMDNAQQDSISYVVSKDPVFASLLKNEDFQRKLVNKLMDIGNETYDNEKINNLINDMSQRMLPSLKETCRRFYGNEKESEISNTYVSRKNFFDNRKGYVISSCINNVDIAQEVASVSISVNDTVGGKVKVNSVYPTLDNEGKWTGEYFKDNAITLTAINKSGYVFVGWKGDVSSKEKTITCDLYNSNTSIEAIFVKDEELNGVPYIDMGEEGYTYLSSIPHVVINQVYGGGKKEAYSDYSFIELYNPTDKDVDLSTWSLLYKSSMDDIDYANAWQKVQLEGVIKSHTSYLIRCGSIKNPLENHISIKNYDFSWNQRINNKGFSLVLKADTNEVVADAQMFDNENKVPLISNYVDMVAVSGNEGLDTQAAPCYEGNVSEVQSKKKTIRRVCFRDTDDNSVEGDFEVVDYSLLIPEYVKWISPKSSVDGEWTYKEEDEPKFTVKFNTNGADEIPDAEFAYLSKITEPKSLEKEGYTFTGWYIDEECTQPYDFNTYPTGDLTIFAGWSTNAYTISFDTNGGNELESLVVASDATIPELPNSTKDGYIFGGWYIDEDCTQRYDYVKMPAKNLLLFAKWEVSKYTVTFKNGDEVVKTETVEYGKCVTAPAVLIKEGYVFEGWYTDIDADGIIIYDFGNKLTQDVVLYAKWKKIEASSSAEPTVEPTLQPTVEPTFQPAVQPTTDPVIQPTEQPATEEPTLIDISDAVVSKIPNKKYTGSKIKPVVVVTYGGCTLKKGKDYTISYKNNRKVGKAKVIIKGKGSYTGKKQITFLIVESYKQYKVKSDVVLRRKASKTTQAIRSIQTGQSLKLVKGYHKKSKGGHWYKVKVGKNYYYVLLKKSVKM